MTLVDTSSHLLDTFINECCWHCGVVIIIDICNNINSLFAVVTTITAMSPHPLRKDELLLRICYSFTWNFAAKDSQRLLKFMI